MSLDDRYDMSIIQNHTEELVYESLEKKLALIPDEDICKCEICIVDMACMALNKLPPRYRASLMGSIYSKAEDEKFEKEVISIVDESIAKISLNPGHK